MTEREAVELTIRVLDDLGIPHAITGSFAITYHGRPRSTHDVDFLVIVEPDQIEPLCSALEGDFYVSGEAAREALQRGGMFNLIHLETMLKVDLWVVSDSAFNRSCLRRRQPAADLFPGAHVVAPEDAILALALHEFEDDLE